jgi:predicted RNase H-like nuclease (RuvC/YqgF family)
MNDIDELIERLREWSPDYATITRATALQEMQQHIAELENDNQELANAIEETDKLNSERIAELEKWNTEMVEKAASNGVLEGYREMGAKIERLDAALKEISLGVVAPMDFAKKARKGD